jgi:hypothetical protein
LKTLKSFKTKKTLKTLKTLMTINSIKSEKKKNSNNFLLHQNSAEANILKRHPNSENNTINTINVSLIKNHIGTKPRRIFNSSL